MPAEIILYGPESLPYALAGDIGNNNNNVTATTAVAGTTGTPQGPYPLGTQLVLRDDRKFRYASVGATTLTVGTTIQASISLTTDTGMSAAAIVATTINPFTGQPTDNAKGRQDLGFTHGAATVIANFFAEGYIYVNVTPGGGDYYKIAAHPALQSGGTGDLVNLWPGNKLRNALTDTTSKVSLLSHAYSRVIKTPATLPTSKVCGVAITPLTGATGRGNFGFLQTRGYCPVLMDNTTGVVGQPAIASTVTSGAVSLVTTTNIITSPIIGTFVFIGASAAFSMVDLSIDG